MARNIKNAVVFDAFCQFGAYMIDSELINEKEIIEECLIYQSTMNNVVGIILFTIGVGCIGTPNPQRMALVGLGLVFSILFYASQQFPPTIKALRQLKKETNSAEISDLLCRVENKHLNYKVLLSKYLIYLIGVLFYALVLFCEGFTCWIKTIPASYTGC